MPPHVPAVECIDDADDIYRQIDSPLMYEPQRDLIWNNVFMFSKDGVWSVVWSRYAPTSDDIRKIGCEREAAKHRQKPSTDWRYAGYISSTAAAVRIIKTSAGHDCIVYHAPCEGIYHAEIKCLPGGGKTVAALSKNEKSDFREHLRRAFGELNPQSCDNR